MVGLSSRWSWRYFPTLMILWFCLLLKELLITNSERKKVSKGSWDSRFGLTCIPRHIAWTRGGFSAALLQVTSGALHSFVCQTYVVYGVCSQIKVFMGHWLTSPSPMWLDSCLINTTAVSVRTAKYGKRLQRVVVFLSFIFLGTRFVKIYQAWIRTKWIAYG